MTPAEQADLDRLRAKLAAAQAKVAALAELLADGPEQIVEGNARNGLAGTGGNDTNETAD